MVAAGLSTGMKSFADYAAQYTASIQPLVPEPVLAVGVFSRPGAMSAALIGQASSAAWMVMNHKAKKASGGLPQNVVLAASPTSVYVFNYRPAWGGRLKVKAPLQVWSRFAFVASVDMPGTLAARVRFHFSDGQLVQLDWNKGFGGEAFNLPFVCHLTQPMMATAVYPRQAA